MQIESGPPPVPPPVPPAPIKRRRRLSPDGGYNYLERRPISQLARAVTRVPGSEVEAATPLLSSLTAIELSCSSNKMPAGGARSAVHYTHPL
ncbi:hypothetical protein EVAR_92585_1 [Eumeta japonica]|uniref:Uncharacterized protein n=1 Tax=Eumeta variegata TaxID=151549 RepID=A0A4C1SZH9_EUMVA|nr:hypothetical protein EVAR_92585_1 [Eumeta japonica]